MATLSDDDLLRYTNQVLVRDVATAGARVAQTELAIRAASARVQRHALSLPACFLRYSRRKATTGSDHADAIIAAAIIAFPLATAVALLSPSSPFVAVVLCSVIIASSYPLTYSAIRTQPDEIGHDRDVIRAARWKSFFRDWASLKSERDRLIDTLNRNRELHQQITRATMKVEEIAALLALDFETLSGSQFEQFLYKAFTVIGYTEVLQTGASGDQGVDLIIGDGIERIAVQAKCYQGAVGNEAVQQAYAGMAHYRCARCAVITNSTFTRSAIELASSTRCRLIDGVELRHLVQTRGRV